MSGVAAAQLWWHLPMMTVIQRMQKVLLQDRKFSLWGIDERVLSNPHPWRIWVNSNDITPSSPENWRSLIGFNTFIYHEVLSCRHFPHYWSRVRGIRPSPVDSLAKGQWCGALIFALRSAWIRARRNCWLSGDWVTMTLTVMWYWDITSHWCLYTNITRYVCLVVK